jgi:hypothetical protein
MSLDGRPILACSTNDVVDADVREPGELLAAQPGDTAANAGVEADELRRDAGAAAAHELAELIGAGHGSIVTGAPSLVRALPGSSHT